MTKGLRGEVSKLQQEIEVTRLVNSPTQNLPNNSTKHYVKALLYKCVQPHIIARTAIISVSSSGSNKEVAILQGHRRKRDLFEGLQGIFLFCFVCLLVNFSFILFSCWLISAPGFPYCVQMVNLAKE
jgi:hypothetical protein